MLSNNERFNSSPNICSLILAFSLIHILFSTSPWCGTLSKISKALIPLKGFFYQFVFCRILSMWDRFFLEWPISTLLKRISIRFLVIVSEDLRRLQVSCQPRDSGKCPCVAHPINYFVSYPLLSLSNRSFSYFIWFCSNSIMGWSSSFSPFLVTSYKRWNDDLEKDEMWEMIDFTIGKHSVFLDGLSHLLATPMGASLVRRLI